MFANRLKKLLALLILISLIPGTLYAQDNNNGRFSRVLKGEQAPFDAWCFNDSATAQLQAALEMQEEKCQIRVLRSLETQKQKHLLELSNLQLRLDTVKQNFDRTLDIKNEEIKSLEAAALKRPNDYTAWWASGGFVVGVATTLVIFFSVN